MALLTDSAPPPALPQSGDPGFSEFALKLQLQKEMQKITRECLRLRSAQEDLDEEALGRMSMEDSVKAKVDAVQAPDVEDLDEDLWRRSMGVSSKANEDALRARAQEDLDEDLWRRSMENSSEANVDALRARAQEDLDEEALGGMRRILSRLMLMLCGLVPRKTWMKL